MTDCCEFCDKPREDWQDVILPGARMACFEKWKDEFEAGMDASKGI